MSTVAYVRREHWNVWTLGGIGYQRHREHVIRARTPWAWALCPVDALTRDIYERFVRPDRPMSDVNGSIEGRPFHVGLDDLLRLWRVDPLR